MTLANAPREIKRRAWTMRNAELTCLDKEDDAPQQSEQTDPRFRLLQSEGDGVPKRWPDRITGRASARRRWSWLRRGRCGGVAGCGSEAGAVLPGRDSASTTIRKARGGGRVRTSEVPRAVAWNGSKRDGSGRTESARETARGRKAGNRRGASCRRRWALLWWMPPTG